MKRQRLWFLFLLSMFVATTATALSHRSLLLRMEWTLRTSELCNPERIEILIFRDGLMLETTTQARGSVSFLRGQATAEDMQALMGTLSASRVGFLRGSCAEDLGQPNLLHVFTLTWFGKYDRRATFEIRAPGGVPCAAEPLAVRNAVFEFRNATWDSDPELSWNGITFPPEPCPCTESDSPDGAG